MKVVNVLISTLDAYEQESVVDGYEWGCACGESYRTQEAAESCRKCRTYLAETPDHVYHVVPSIYE